MLDMRWNDFSYFFDLQKFKTKNLMAEPYLIFYVFKGNLYTFREVAPSKSFCLPYEKESYKES